MQYPEETIAVSKQGKKEVRVLQEKGQYVKYNYKDPKTGKETTKYSLILKSENKKEHLMAVPLKTGKSLIIKQEIEDRKIKLWGKDKKKEVDPF